MRAGELATALRTACPAVVVTGARYRSAVESVTVAGDASACTLIDASELRAVAIASLGSGNGPIAVPVERAAADSAILLLTSGTTGMPKPVRLTHGFLFADVTTRMVPPVLAEDAANLLCVPTYHVAGIGQVLSSVYAGRALHVMPGFDASQWMARSRPSGSGSLSWSRPCCGASWTSQTLTATTSARWRSSRTGRRRRAGADRRGDRAFPCVLRPQQRLRADRDPRHDDDPDAGRPCGCAHQRARIGCPAQVSFRRPTIPGVVLDILRPGSDALLPDGETGEVPVTQGRGSRAHAGLEILATSRTVTSSWWAGPAMDHSRRREHRSGRGRAGPRFVSGGRRIRGRRAARPGVGRNRDRLRGAAGRALAGRE